MRDVDGGDGVNIGRGGGCLWLSASGRRPTAKRPNYLDFGLTFTDYLQNKYYIYLGKIKSIVI